MGIIQSASGYGGMEAGPFSRVVSSDFIALKHYERNWLNEVTNTSIMAPIEKCGQVLQVPVAPEIGGWTAYQKNMQLTPNTVSTTGLCLTMCNAAYNDFKFDTLDVNQLCDRFGPFQELFLEGLVNSYVDLTRQYVVGTMLTGADDTTSGPTAGKFGDINLGMEGAPIHITPDNLAMEASKLRRALKEQQFLNSRSAGEFFIIVPPAVTSYLAALKYNSVINTCECNLDIPNMWDIPIMGFKTIETVHSPVKFENGQVCYYIIAGWREATAFGTYMPIARVITEDPNSFGIRYQYLATWGAETIYTKALAVAYWTFDPV